MHLRTLLFLLSCVPLSAETNMIIRHVPVTKFAYPGQPITFRAQVIPVNCTITSATLMVKVKGELFYTRFLGMKTNTSFTDFITSLTNKDETKNSLEYRIMAENNFHAKKLLPENSAFNLEVLPVEEALIPAVSGGKIILPDGSLEESGTTSLSIPADSLYEDGVFGIEYYSPDSIPSAMDLNQFQIKDNEHLLDDSLPTALYHFYTLAGDRKNDFSFRKKVDITLRYFYDKNISDENKLEVFFWDGLHWQTQSSVKDLQHRTLSFISDFIAFFGIFEENRIGTGPGPGALLDYVSRPSFAPMNGDVVIFGIKSTIQDYRIRILDMKARLIRELDTASWDGRDRDGNYVESGVYIYQVSSGGKTVSGMICVLK